MQKIRMSFEKERGSEHSCFTYYSSSTLKLVFAVTSSEKCNISKESNSHLNHDSYSSGCARLNFKSQTRLDLLFSQVSFPFLLSPHYRKLALTQTGIK